MSGQPPYWGALPPPAVVAQRQASVRRNSYNANRKPELPDNAALSGLYDSPYPSEAQPARVNRQSQQSNTTQSTENSFASPREEQFDRGGLAPRPASYQSQPYNREAEERRRRRASRQQAEERAEYERSQGIRYDGGVTSSGPIKSNGNGHGIRPNRQSSHRQTQSQDHTPLREPEDFYRGEGNRYKPQRGPLSVDTNLGRAETTGSRSQQQQAADDAERGIRRGSVTARKEKPEIRSAVEDTRARRGSSRRVSEVSQEGFTSDKSPLQALEANYTKLKEEKRAKAQEAERQIRERQASGASAQSARGAQNTVHFDGSSEQAAKTVPQRAIIEVAGQDISPTTTAPNRQDSQRKLSALSQPLEDRPSQRKLQKDPPSAIHSSPQTSANKSSAPQKVPTVIESGVQRNASFRERAAVGPDIILGSTAAVSRSNTNKLKKNPPGDPWRLTREDIRAQAEAIARARKVERGQQQRMASGGPLGSSPIDPPPQQMMPGGSGSGRSHANTKKQREALYAAAQPLHQDEDEVDLASTKRSGPQRKAEQLLGSDLPFQRPNPDIRRAISPAEQQLYADRLDRSEELGPDGHGDIYGVTPVGRRQNVPISAITGDNISDGEYEHARGSDGRHHFSSIIRGGRGNYRPGDGLYQPDVHLDEWKSAGIASLTGALLDLDTNAQAASAAQSEADKDKAWWEAGNTGKRRPSTGASGRVRAVEAFGGDMSSEGNNGTVFSDFSYSYEDVAPGGRSTTPRTDTPSYLERWGRVTDELFDIPERSGSPAYSDRYGRGATPGGTPTREVPPRLRSPYSQRSARPAAPRMVVPPRRSSRHEQNSQSIAETLEQLVSEAPPLPGLHIPEREKSKRRGAVAVVGSDEDHVIPRARNYIGFDGTSKRQSTVRKRNRSLVQPTRFSKKARPKKKPSARRAKPPTVAATEAVAVKRTSTSTSTKLQKKPSFFMKDCAHPERHTIFHPFHTCKPSILTSKYKRKSSKKDKLTHIPTLVPTTFTPKLYLKCGPLLRYTGIRRETVSTRPGQPKRRDREIWRGSVMIVTTDAASDYHEPPKLRLFKQPRSLLPPPPETLASGKVLAHEYIDPVANHPKCGRDGQTLYVKPVEFLPEEKDLSRDESDRGLFSRQPNNSYPTSTMPTIDGDRLPGKSVSVRGFRLHTERGATFWRFNIEVELTTQQQRIAYRINNGPSIGFWVPALGEGMNIMNYSCNGFSMSVNSDMFSGPDPLWRDVLNNHQTKPFHVMIGGGDQVYNDCVMRETSVFAEWLGIKNPLFKHNAPFTREMQDELEDFYLERYAMWFSQGLFSLANSQIPMVNLWDDHDIIDGFGSYPHHFMDSPVFTGLGAIAFKYYMLFQHQSSVDEGPANESSWLLGTKPGPYIKERSRSLFMSLGGGLSFLGLDCRTERTRDEILSEQTYDAILDRCYAELVKGTTTHLIVLLGVPIAYPRLVWLENILTSRIMDPIKALSRAGAFGNLLNNFDGGVEILDDLDDHWTAKNHKAERRFLIQDLQDLAASKSVRITILSGDVHLAAIGQFFSSGGADGMRKTGQVPKDKDHRYMPNVISSAIVNTPPPDMLADVLARRDKVHHLDGDTDENMIPLFGVDVDGKKRNNKVMLPRRNWASIRVYDELGSPPGTPGASRDPSPEKSGGIGGMVRRLSMTRNDSFGNGPRRNDSFGPRPPISGGGGGLLRRLSTSRGRPPPGTFDGAGEAVPQRRSSSTGGIGGLIRRLSMSRNRPPKRRDRGGINGYDSSDEEEEYRPYRDAPDIVRTKQGTFLRGGAGDLSSDEEEYNPTRLRGGGSMTRSEEAIERQHGYFPPKKGYRRGEDAHDSDGGTATPPPIRTGMRGPPQGAPIARSNTFADSRHASIAQGVPGSRDGLQRSNTTNTLRKSLHRTPTGMSAKGGIFGRKAAIEPVNLEGGLEITLNVEVNRKDPAGITAPYRLLVPRLWYEEPVRPEGGLGGVTDGAMETPPLQRGNSFSGGLGGLMRRLSTKGKIPTQAEIEREQPVVRDDGYAQPRVGDTIGTEGLQRKATVTDRVKGVFGLGLGRRRSGESYSGTGSESGEDPHADSRLVPLAKYGKKGQIKKENIGKPILNPGPGIEDEETGLSRAPPAAPTAPQPPAKPTAYRNEPSRTVYRDLNTEAALERRSLDRPQGGMQRANSLSAKLKGAMGLGRRDSAGSYTDEEHDDTYDTTQGHVGLRPMQQQTRQRESIDRGAPARPDAGMKRGNSLGGGLKKALGLGRRDSVESFSGSERSYDEPVLPPSKQTAPARDTRGPYPSLQQENQQRRQSLDRPQAGIQRRNTLTDKLKGVVGLGRRDSYSGSEVETDDISPHDQRRAPLAKEPPRPPRTQDTRGLPPSQRQSMDTGRPQQGPRKSSLGEGLKKAMGLGRRDSYSDHSYSEDDESHLEPQTRNNAAGQRDGVPLPQDQTRGAEKKYPPQPQAQKQSLDTGRRSLDTGRPQQGPRKSSLGSGLKKAMGLGRRSSFSDHSYSEEDDSVLPPRNNAAGQRLPPPQADTNPYPSRGQKSQPPPRASVEQGRPAGHQRKSSLGGGLAKAIGLGGGRRDDYDSQTESDDESIARRQANERANATGDMRYPSLPQGDSQTRGSQAHGRQPPMNNMPRQSLDRRDSQRNRVDSGPMPVKRKGMGFGAGVKNMMGLGRKESLGSRSGSERSWSEDGGEEEIGRMPRGDERSAVTDDEGDRRFRKVSGTRVERGAPVLKEGMSGFTRQERQRARLEELGREMERPAPAR